LHEILIVFAMDQRMDQVSHDIPNMSTYGFRVRRGSWQGNRS